MTASQKVRHKEMENLQANYVQEYPDNVEAFDIVLVPPGKAPGIPVTIVQLLFLNSDQLLQSLGILDMPNGINFTGIFFKTVREAPLKKLQGLFRHCPNGGGSRPLAGWFGALI